MFRISDTTSGNVTSSLRAHSGEITDIAISEDDKSTIIASASRDRTIQLFTLSANGLDLLQTLDEHAGSVTCLMFAKAGSQLISCSADRTVVVREAVQRDGNGPPVFVIARTITLKNSPTSMRPSQYEDAVLLSATDRCIQLVNTQSGRIMFSFKAADAEGGDAVVMSSLAHLPSSTGPPIVAGVSSSDKSVRLYSEDGYLLARDWGHTEGVTDIAVVLPLEGQEGTRIVTVAADGTIFVWNTEQMRPASSGSDQSASGAPSTPSSAELPVRKVISTAEIARFHRSQSADVDENEPPSPTASAALRVPTGLKHKSSRLSVKTTPRLDPSPLTNHGVQQSSKGRQRSPSPPSPLAASPSRTRHTGHLHNRVNRSGSIPTTEAEKHHSSGSGRPVSRGGFGSVAASTEQLCRTLDAFRRRLEKAPGSVAPDSLTDLERELEMTMNLVGKTLGKDALCMQEKSRCASSQEASFVSADSHQSSEGQTSGGAVAADGEED